jgi:hypothetical protein
MPTHPLHSQAILAKNYAFFTYFEAFVVVVFTFEYIIRTWAAPKRGAHMREVMNVIDLLAFLPWYLEIFIAVAVPPDFKYLDQIEVRTGDACREGGRGMGRRGGGETIGERGRCTREKK